MVLFNKKIKCVVHCILYLYVTVTYIHTEEVNINNFVASNKGTSTNISSEKSQIFSKILLPTSRILPYPIWIDPDYPNTHLHYTLSRLHYSVGHELSLFSINTSIFHIVFTLGTMIEVHNFNNKILFPGQMWRGTVYGGVYIQLPTSSFLTYKHQFTIFLSLYHESNHIIDLLGYLQEFSKLNSTPITGFENNNFRSFEQIKVKLIYSYNLLPKHTLFVVLGIKYYTVLLKFLRLEYFLRYSFNTEVKYKLHLIPELNIVLSYYFEYIYAEFQDLYDEYIFTHEDNSLLYNIIEVAFNSKYIFNSNLSIFINYNYSNGRGLDFFKRTAGYGIGVRFVI